MNSLTFNAMQFHPIQSNDQQIWIPSTELSRALGYSRADAVTKIYDRNNDEFAHDMTKIIDNPQNPNLVLRVFSLRGCHLIAIFARTPVAKEFRKWVLDVLEKEVLQQQIDTRVKINSEQQAEIKVTFALIGYVIFAFIGLTPFYKFYKYVDLVISYYEKGMFLSIFIIVALYVICLVAGFLCLKYVEKCADCGIFLHDFYKVAFKMKGTEEKNDSEVAPA
ncbi:hypothetical protein B9T24_13985 [Acinetobacter sp. ANC 4654]|uniref:BRO-N domain-containing protein n=1 Tax=Acinetobacter sp. ANC 4654 TaxID=1977872 RepID=UPI000A333604|nr:BRO family protein [Acinetobacter sp. ANC 4654]OTG93577.1 hypothetical protein B9T24_13985 [Acinetobacter sp. ANC 4654]